MPYQMDYIEPAPLDARAEQTMVPMRDGVRLATDVYLPAVAGPLPAVLVRLPYDKCGRYTFMPQIAPFVTDRGYAFVAQDVRGKFRSEGETLPFVHEVEDGYDTLEWIAAQPWSDGTVGMWGDSYYGYTQWAAVASGHPALRAIVPRVTATDFVDSPALVGRLRCCSCTAPTTWRTSGPTATSTTSRSTTAIGRWRSSSTRASPPSARAARRSTASCSGAGPAGSRLFPHGRHPFDRQKVPALHSVGWFDNVMPYSMRDYVAPDGRSRSAPASSTCTPSRSTTRTTGSRTCPSRRRTTTTRDDAAMERLIPRLVGPGLDFFDVFLRGHGRPDDVPRVRWRAGHGDWSDVEDVAAAGRAEAAAPSRRAGPGRPRRRGRRLLGETAEPGTGRAVWTHDPARLVPSVDAGSVLAAPGWPDETAGRGAPRRPHLHQRARPLAPLELAGPVTAHLAAGVDLRLHARARQAARRLARTARRACCCAGRPTWPAPPTARRSPSTSGTPPIACCPGIACACTSPRATSRSTCWHPGTGEDPWWATKVRAERADAVHGGRPRVLVDLTVLKGRAMTRAQGGVVMKALRSHLEGAGLVAAVRGRRCSWRPSARRRARSRLSASAPADALTLRIGTTSDADTVNPFTMLETLSFEAVSLNYNLLFDLDLEGKPRADAGGGGADAGERRHLGRRQDGDGEAHARTSSGRTARR